MRVQTPGKRLTWQDLPEDSKVSARKREWGELVAPSTAAKPPVFPSPLSANWDKGGLPEGPASARGSLMGGARGGEAAWKANLRRASSGELSGPMMSADKLAGYPPAASDGRECKVRLVVPSARLGGRHNPRCTIGELESIVQAPLQQFMGVDVGWLNRASSIAACLLCRSVTDGRRSWLRRCCNCQR